MPNRRTFAHEDLTLLLEARDSLLAAPANKFYLLDNPFEKKYAWKNHSELPTALESIVNSLENLVDLASEMCCAKLYKDFDRYYCGIFKYPKNSFLMPHVDAGICPRNGLRKHATVVLALNQIDTDAGGCLQFWHGTSCMSEEPKLLAISDYLSQTIGSGVLFENSDFAWHGVSRYTGAVDRLIVTVSFMSIEVDMFKNLRKRAYFVPIPGEPWDSDTYKLRDKRASVDLAGEVYRVNAQEAGHTSINV